LNVSERDKPKIITNRLHTHTQHLFQSNEQSNISGASVLPSKRVLAYNIVSDLVIEDKILLVRYLFVAHYVLGNSRTCNNAIFSEIIRQAVTTCILLAFNRSDSGFNPTNENELKCKRNLGRAQPQQNGLSSSLKMA